MRAAPATAEYPRKGLRTRDPGHGGNRLCGLECVSPEATTARPFHRLFKSVVRLNAKEPPRQDPKTSIYHKCGIAKIDPPIWEDGGDSYPAPDSSWSEHDR